MWTPRLTFNRDLIYKFACLSYGRGQLQLRTFLPKPACYVVKMGFLEYFRDPQHVLLLKIDVFLLFWLFIAGIMKELDQTATTQAFVTGMREDLKLYGNELVEFNTYFSIGYAIGLVPGQIIQTKLRPSIFLPACEIVWGLVVLL
jgi:MFS transporter, ACS family, pantothenate transporter